MAKEWTPTIRNKPSKEEMAKEKRVHVRWLKPGIPLEGATIKREGLVQEHRASVAAVLEKKGLVEIVEIAEVKVVKAKSKKRKTEADAAANDDIQAPG